MSDSADSNSAKKRRTGLDGTADDERAAQLHALRAELAQKEAELAAERAAKEAERAAKEAERAAKEAERAAKESKDVAAKFSEVNGKLREHCNERSASRSRSRSRSRGNAPSTAPDAAADCGDGDGKGAGNDKEGTGDGKGQDGARAEAGDDEEDDTAAAAAAAVAATDGPATADAIGTSDVEAAITDVSDARFDPPWELPDDIDCDPLTFTDLDGRKSELTDLRDKEVRLGHDNRKLSEIDDTQPFVNRLLRDVRKQVDSATPRGQSLYLFQERKKERDNDDDKFVVGLGYHLDRSRCPDAAFFMRDSAATNVKFDKTAQRSAVLTVEVKRCLDAAHLRNALHEVERDFAELAGGQPTRTMRVGYSIITSGFKWRFVRMWWTVDSRGKWMRTMEASRVIDFVTDGASFWSTLGRWMKFALTKAMDLPTRQTDLNLELEFNGYRYQLDAVLSSGERSTVSRWESAEGTAFVLKVPAGGSNERKARLSEYFNREAENLDKLMKYVEAHRDVERFFPRRVPVLHVEAATALCLSDEGCALDLLDICGTAGRELALVVKRDIWQGAIDALKELDLRHCDIYATNIVVNGAGDARKAKLIDWESAVGLGSPGKVHSPTHTPEVDHKVEDLDAKCAASMLWFLWDYAAASFVRKTHVQHVRSGRIAGKPFRDFVAEVQ